MSDDATPSGVVDEGRLRYDSNNELHVQIGPDDEAVVNLSSGDRYMVLCGASLPGGGMEVNGMRLETEFQRGRLCDSCLERLKEREVTISGFMTEGKVVPRVD